ncbi:MAG TPA: formate/nitrite transporter family protein [Acidimicrobiales bacterium]|jgi:formate-nitrite transporter family protein|nr:formate/nitrite transporter family protein [Acidimicrobiales bacterium]
MTSDSGSNGAEHWPTPRKIYERSVAEGNRRLDASGLELVATGFIAGFTIVFGIAAQAITAALLEPEIGAGPAKLAGSLAFGVGLVFLIIGRAELFTENFFGPVGAAYERRAEGGVVALLARLWGAILVLNLVGGVVFAAIISVDGALPAGAPAALNHLADEIVDRPPSASLANAIAGGTLITLLSFLLHAASSTTARVIIGYLVGVVLALGPFNHVVVTTLHLAFGVLHDGPSVGDGIPDVALALAGNMLGGLGFVTLTHIAQAKGEPPPRSHHDSE